jgi:hypothetical protein
MSNTTMREALRESAAEAKSAAAGKSSSDATAVRDKPPPTGNDPAPEK